MTVYSLVRSRDIVHVMGGHGMRKIRASYSGLQILMQPLFLRPTSMSSRVIILISASLKLSDTQHLLCMQAHFVLCGGLKLLLGILTDKKFLSKADNFLRR